MLLTVKRMRRRKGTVPGRGGNQEQTRRLEESLATDDSDLYSTPGIR